MIKEKQLKVYCGLLVFAVAFLFMFCINAKQVKAGDYSSAEILPLNGAWGSEYWLTDEDYEQWYKLVVPSDGKLTYKVMGYCSVNYELYDEVCALRFHSGHTGGSVSSPDTNTITEVLSGGVYYLKITPYYGSLGKYKLNIAFSSYNTNNANAVSYDNPQIISLGEIITGAITPTDEEDWYCISISKAGYYHFQFTSFTPIRYTLYNSDLSKTIESGSMASHSASESSPGTHEKDIIFSQGNYYLKVFRTYSYHYGKYTFKISQLSQSACSHDYEKTYVDATYTRQGYTLQTCSKCGYSYKDNYESKRMLSTPSIYSLNAGKKKATVSWGTVSDASGYQISYKINGKTKQTNVSGGKKTQKTIKKLKSKKKCAVRVRAYKKEGKAVAYSKWSSKRTVKIR